MMTLAQLYKGETTVATESMRKAVRKK